MKYTKGAETFELHIYRNGESGWYQVESFKNRGDQLLAASKIMDEGYDFDEDGNKVKVGSVEIVRVERLTHEVSKEAGNQS